MKNEVYKLTLEHYIVDDDGKKVPIDEPIFTQCVTRMEDGISIPIVLNSMFEKMRNYLLEIQNDVWKQKEQYQNRNNVCSKKEEQSTLLI